MRDYQITSPSLEGVLNHSSLLYDGIKRPLELLRVLDGPASKGTASVRASKDIRIISLEDKKVLGEYFHDLHGVFLKRLSHFVVEADTSSDDSIKLQAMLQEMIKVRGLMAKGR